MKKLFTISIAIFLFANITKAQDTLYIYQNGAVVGKRAISEIDSVTFYKIPETPVISIPSIEFNGTLYVYPTDNSAGIQWYNGSSIITGATSLTDGEANSIAIITNQGAGAYAAQVCADLNSLGFDDWYLPAKDELNAIYLNKDAIGGLGLNAFWSSSEVDNGAAWLQGFSDGVQYNFYAKSNPMNVRCVRRDDVKATITTK